MAVSRKRDVLLLVMGRKEENMVIDVDKSVEFFLSKQINRECYSVKKEMWSPKARKTVGVIEQTWGEKRRSSRIHG